MKTIKNILFWVTVVFLLLTIVVILTSKLFGVEYRSVITGSMTPEIPVGSLVIIVPTPADDIRIGDDISFVTVGEKVVTHRVIDINLEEDKFVTWGIANSPNAIDAPNRYENILGVVKVRIPKLGFVFNWLGKPHGKIITIMAILVIFIISSIIGIWKKDVEEKDISEQKQCEPVGNTLVKELIDSFKQSEKMFLELSNSNSLTESNIHSDISFGEIQKDSKSLKELQEDG